jgi:hypothetical protein
MLMKQTYALPAILIPLGAAMTCFVLSNGTSKPTLLPDQKRMLYLNVISSATSYVLAFEMLDHDLSVMIEDHASFALVGLAAFFSRVLGVHAYISPLQLISFVVAIVCASDQHFVGKPYSKIESVIDPVETMELSDRSETELTVISDRSSLEAASLKVEQSTLEFEYKKRLLVKITLLVLAVAAWTWFLFGNFWPLPNNTASTRLDLEYNPGSEIDIVVSMYKDSPSELKDTIDRIKRIPEIGQRHPRLIIYTKDPSADIDQLQKQTGAKSVIQLSNVGREGHTYLHHIIEQWDDLAAQTFFLQAEIHNSREFFPRVRDYYTAQTGMLSLGFSGQTCSCRNCGDRFGWWDNTLVPEIWSQVMNETCVDQQMLLSYKGQFVASAARLRANKKSLYETLRTALENPENLVHQEDYLKGRRDSMNAPFFGYTLERSWSVILQCSEERIAARCPTLLSGTRRGGSKEDCQCLDVS